MTFSRRTQTSADNSVFCLGRPAEPKLPELLAAPTTAVAKWLEPHGGRRLLRPMLNCIPFDKCVLLKLSCEFALTESLSWR